MIFSFLFQTVLYTWPCSLPREAVPMHCTPLCPLTFVCGLGWMVEAPQREEMVRVEPWCFPWLHEHSPGWMCLSRKTIKGQTSARVSFESTGANTSGFFLTWSLHPLLVFLLYVSQAIGESYRTHLHNPVLFETPLCILILSVNETQSWLQTSPEKEWSISPLMGVLVFLHIRHFYPQTSCLVVKSE